MSTIFVCDGCGKKTEEIRSGFSPHDWYQRTEYRDGRREEFHACSRACIEKAKERFGGTGLVLPI